MVIVITVVGCRHQLSAKSIHAEKWDLYINKTLNAIILASLCKNVAFGNYLCPFCERATAIHGILDKYSRGLDRSCKWLLVAVAKGLDAGWRGVANRFRWCADPTVGDAASSTVGFKPRTACGRIPKPLLD
jgi:hypothetical protein